MQVTKPRETLLNRFVPLMLLGFSALHLVDWAYGRFADPWKLVNGVGLLLMGGTYLVANRLGVTNSPSPSRNWLLALGVVGFALAVAATMHRWL